VGVGEDNLVNGRSWSAGVDQLGEMLSPKQPLASDIFGVAMAAMERVENDCHRRVRVASCLSQSAALGTKVSIVEAAPRILPQEDTEISGHVAKEFVRRGISVVTGATVSAVRREASGAVLEIRDGNTGVRSLHSEAVLVAAGIVGNTENLGLEALKVRIEKSHIVVDGACATNVQGIYAIGDVAGPPWLAHKASHDHEAIICVERIAGHDPAPLHALSVPSCTFSHPQVASVGLTEEAARNTGANISGGKFPFAASGKAIAVGATSGFVKTVFDSDSEEILGAHLVGEDFTELIHGYVVARTLETTSEELIASVFPHPTLSWAMHGSVLGSRGTPLHS
jgi:dihydrolipoamide dehydrogenase